MGRLDSEVLGAKDTINRHMKRVLQFTQAFYTKVHAQLSKLRAGTNNWVV